MIRYYKVNVKGILSSNNEELKKEVLSILTEKEYEMTMLFFKPTSEREAKTEELTKRYGVKPKRMWEVKNSSLEAIRNYIESTYSIGEMNDWYEFDFEDFFKKRNARINENKSLERERTSLIDLVKTGDDNMGIRGSGTSDMVGQKVVKLEKLDKKQYQNNLCEKVLNNLIEACEPIEQAIIESYLSTTNLHKSREVVMNNLASKFHTTKQQIYIVKRKFLKEAENWLKANYLYNEEEARINFAMSRKWNLENN